MPSRSCSCVCRSAIVLASSADRVERAADSLVLALAAASRSALRGKENYEQNYGEKDVDKRKAMAELGTNK